MTFQEIFEEVKSVFMSGNVSNYDGHLALQVNLTGEGEGAFYAEIKDKQLYVEPYEYYDRDVLFTVDSGDFLRIVHGKLNLTKALEIQNLIQSE